MEEQKLPTVGDVDEVRLTSPGGLPAPPIQEIKDRTIIAQLMDFVNGLPNEWSVPWYGPPVGQLNFDFYQNGKYIGNFYVGKNFFGRDARGEFWSRNASPQDMNKLGKIAGFDLNDFLNQKK